MKTPTDFERWFFGTGPWTPRVGARVLNPMRWVRQYRALRRPRMVRTVCGPVWPLQFKRHFTRLNAIRFVAWCCWREATGWSRTNSSPPPGILRGQQYEGPNAGG